MITSEFSKRVFLGFCMALTVVWVYPAISEGAGCGGGSCGGSESSCCFCHETEGEMRILSNGDHHKDHAFGDFCVFCHGGRVEQKSKAEAHEGLRAKPMSDVKKSCSGCHPDDFQTRAEGYGEAAEATRDAGSGTADAPADALAIAPPTPDPSAVKQEDLVDSNLAAKAEEAETPSGMAVEQPGGEAGPWGSNNLLSTGLILLVAILVTAFLFRRKKS